MHDKSRQAILRLVILLAVGSLHAELPPEAQSAMDRGVIAAKQQDYPLALRFFEDARKLAPESPELHFNLGLTESKIPGRELRATAWFGAYLTANPTAPNTRAVRQQIAVLDVTSQSSISRLLVTTRNAADQTLGAYRVERLLKVVRLWLDFGDISEALKTSSLMIHSIKDRDERVFNAPTSEGLSIRDQEKRHVTNYRDFALRDIAFSQTSRGDIKGTLKIIDLMKYSATKSLVLDDIANHEIKAGNIAGAKKTLQAALRITERIDREPSSGYQGAEYNKSLAQARIAWTQAFAGDVAGAKQTIELIRNNYYLKCLTQLDISDIQAKAGNGVGAQTTLSEAINTAAHITEASQKEDAKAAIARVQAKLSAVSAADSFQRPMPDTPSPPQPKILVTDWLQKLDDDGKDSKCPLNTEPFLDLPAHLKSLPADDLDGIYGGLIDAANNFVSAQNVIHEMLKQQTGK